MKPFVTAPCTPLPRVVLARRGAVGTLNPSGIPINLCIISGVTLMTVASLNPPGPGRMMRGTALSVDISVGAGFPAFLAEGRPLDAEPPIVIIGSLGLRRKRSPSFL